MKAAIQKPLRSIGYELRQTGDGWYTQKNWDEAYRRYYDEEALMNRRFYNVGAANFYHWAWTNIDKVTQTYSGKQTDILIDYDLLDIKPLPIEDNVAEVLYTSHTIEHVTDEAVQNLFNEAFRTLKPGGYFRVTCPNVDLAYRAWQDGDREYFYWQHNCSSEPKMSRSNYRIPLKSASLEQLFVSNFAFNATEIHNDGVSNPLSDDEIRDLFTRLPYVEALNACKSRLDLDIQKRHPNNHVNWFNAPKLDHMLHFAGFKTIYLSGYGQSFCPILKDTTRFDNTHPKMSIYMEAIKA